MLGHSTLERNAMRQGCVQPGSDNRRLIPRANFFLAAPCLNMTRRTCLAQRRLRSLADGQSRVGPVSRAAPKVEVEHAFDLPKSARFDFGRPSPRLASPDDQAVSPESTHCLPATTSSLSLFLLVVSLQ